VRRHELDWISLIAGIVFTGIALLYLVVAVTDVTVDQRLVWPLVLVAIGAAGVATAVSANLREEKRFVTEAADPLAAQGVPAEPSYAVDTAVLPTPSDTEVLPPQE
jgi:hypothetical protein